MEKKEEEEEEEGEQEDEGAQQGSIASLPGAPGDELSELSGPCAALMALSVLAASGKAGPGLGGSWEADAFGDPQARASPHCQPGTKTGTWQALREHPLPCRAKEGSWDP